MSDLLGFVKVFMWYSYIDYQVCIADEWCGIGNYVLALKCTVGLVIIVNGALKTMYVSM